ncbi:MAG TPA: SUMF1/EgtB/PvdO family nonheme iron enzyme [Nitrococcus sp.]|nr:SUMF1/EgtB/PvdO family nonheme iron enzyme [Nitrococcus sp.]
MTGCKPGRAQRVAELAAMHRCGQNIVGGLSPEDVRIQYHGDLSPLGWHLGHCAFIETYWLREVILGNDSVTAPLHDVYFPDLCERAARSNLLLGRDQLLEWTHAVHNENLLLLAEPPESIRQHRLMAADYLLDFLIQHYAQHLEIMHYVLAQRQLRGAGLWLPNKKLAPASGTGKAIQLPEGPVTIGCDEPCAYDNEQPRHEIWRAGGRIAAHPVTNAEYLAFMLDGGYRRPQLWSAAGRAWLADTQTDCPATWRRSEHLWYEVNAFGPRDLQPNAAVRGLCFYEAAAFCRWVGARLPHEFEWEVAAQMGLLEGIGQAWEWCANRFHPYPGFRPFPYAGYSTPWFDDRHGVLRGASEYTLPPVRRASFRNFYNLDKRHICAGLRLAWD